MGNIGKLNSRKETLGGKVFWQNIESKEKFTLQRWKLSKTHYRILGTETNIRFWWDNCTEKEAKDVLSKMEDTPWRPPRSPVEHLSAQGLKPVKEAAVEAVDDLLADEGPVSNLINRKLTQATKNVGIWLLAQTVVALISILYVKLVETPQTEGKLDPWLVWQSIYIGLSALTALLLVRKWRLMLDRGITETAKKIQVSKEKIELSMYRRLKDHAPRIFLLLSIAIGLSIGIYLITGHFLKTL